LERFLYRISVSPRRDRFLLKGALLFSLWYESPRRPTRDADLLGLDSLGTSEIAEVFKELCVLGCDDGMRYLPDTVRAEEIREDARYGGVRVTLLGMLGNARCTVQVDVGSGDAVTPEPELVLFPAILEDHPSPRLFAYPKETVVAEKLEAIVSLGMANSRMKDYFDLHVLLGESAFDESLLATAIGRTFERRRTTLPTGVPLGLSDEFARESAKNTQWQAFLAKNRLEAPPLDVAITGIRARVLKLFALAAG
ncbi:MAG: nucleotidyl transferase AbiEii/AbiGii toxin family protein, partial [Spirochaetaceae bacterium]|nr:nucleotidyl transferase AbiEii/AbiGii toxin family protein [Spirochaetaceae bacterium]